MSVTVPGGFANAHSHVFHRALRGRAQAPGSFWTWREQMYDLAAALDPDLLHRLARAVYGEMRLAGWTAVGEFHYVHHGPGGRRYDDPNAMGDALVAAAREAGIAICLLDTCYLASGFGEAPQGVQTRFSDGDADAWASRVEEMRARHAGEPDVVVGAAAHSVRAVPADQLGTVAAWAQGHRAPLHVHLSEQPAENQACLAAHGMTPTALLDAHGFWGPATTAVHATHLTDDDVATIGAASSFACFCPTTERDLADGVGPGPALEAAGARLTLGSDGHAVVDPFAEMRALEDDERLVSGRRGTWSASRLLRAGGPDGHASLGLPGSHDVEVAWGGPHLAGVPEGPEGLVFGATAADVVNDPDEAHAVADELRRAVEDCWARVGR
ncbi:MAG: formimidoylglutamate deiminase [Nocardioidaceae bacterium]|nr:formimidoylglutamate deiminase [Nocardioidaceae bacterium]